MSRHTKAHSPAYAQIALDIAGRIARGELKEEMKVSGRSTMSSEYGVSPETIRRALILLEQTGIVHVVEKSGVVIKSKEKALTYLQQYAYESGVELLRDDLKDAMARKAEIDKEITQIVKQIIDMTDRFSNSDPLNKFEVVITKDSKLIGKTLKESKFYQQTKATVIALKRNRQILASPGPDVVFCEDDVIVLVGRIDSEEDVKQFVEKQL